MTNHPSDPAPELAPPLAAPSPFQDPTIAPRSRQAAWRFGARQKTNGVAWGLWGASFFVLLIPLHGFYLGRILQSVLRGVMSVGALMIFYGSYIAFFFTATSQLDAGSTSLPVPGPLIWVGFAVAAALGIACLIWWIVDATRMGRRLEAINERIRQRVADEHGVGPWSF